jgi:hypothetical protein
VGGFVSLGLSLEDASPTWRRDLSQASFVNAVGRPYEDGGVNPRDPEARFTAARLIDATIVADALGFDPVQKSSNLAIAAHHRRNDSRSRTASSSAGSESVCHCCRRTILNIGGPIAEPWIGESNPSNADQANPWGAEPRRQQRGFVLQNQRRNCVGSS